MKNISEKHLQRLQYLNKKVEVKLNQLRNWRLLTGLLWFAILIGIAAKPTGALTLLGVLVFPVLFLFFVKATAKVHYLLQQIQALQAFYHRQKQRYHGLHDFTWNAPRGAPENPLILDLKLLEKPGLLSQIDESFTDGGQSELLKWMLDREPKLETIKERQSLIQKLSKRIGALVRWKILGSLIDHQISSQQLLEFTQASVLNEGFKKAFTIVGISWLLVVVSMIPLLSAGLTSVWILLLLVYIGVSLGNYETIQNSFKRGEGLSHNFSALEPLLKRMEEFSKDPELSHLCPIVQSGAPSQEIKSFRRVLAFLSIEANPIISFLINVLVPWNYIFSWLLEKQRLKIAPNIPSYLDELHRLEALASLVFVNRYQDVVFPKVSSEKVFSIDEARHPIIPKEQVVANSFEFKDGAELILLTGSNMAGKSTFLRTLGVNQILANMGAPVFAKSFKTSLYRIESCIQVSDSLRDGFSYFYAEVNRLKELIEEIQSDRPCLFLIDEIFRGTNNKERFLGSQAVIKSLVSHNSIGLVSTHDLELTKMEDELKSLKNYHFREQVNDGLMSFSYKIHEGPCPTTNALIIMKQNGLAVDA